MHLAVPDVACDALQPDWNLNLFHLLALQLTTPPNTQCRPHKQTRPQDSPLCYPAVLRTGPFLLRRCPGPRITNFHWVGKCQKVCPYSKILYFRCSLVARVFLKSRDTTYHEVFLFLHYTKDRTQMFILHSYSYCVVIGQILPACGSISCKCKEIRPRSIGRSVPTSTSISQQPADVFRYLLHVKSTI